MPNPVQLLHTGGVPSPPTQIIYGEVSYNQPLPKSFTDPLFVVIPDISLLNYYTITIWPACHGTALPKAGAECMLIRDVRQSSPLPYRCIWWEGVTEFVVLPFTGDQPTGTIYLFSTTSSPIIPPPPPTDVWATWGDAKFTWGTTVAGTEWQTSFVGDV